MSSDTIKTFFITIERWVMMFFNDSVTPDTRFMLRIFIILVILLASAGVSADIAEKRNRGILTHFILGFILPLLYPVLIFCFLKRTDEIYEKKQEKKIETVIPDDYENPLTKRLREIREKNRARRGEVPEDTGEAVADSEQMAVEAPEVPAAATAAPADSEAAPAGLTPEYFEAIAVDSTGARNGPFRIVFDDEFVEPLIAERITAIVGEVVAFDIIDAKTNNTKRVRLQMSRIKSCEKI